MGRRVADPTNPVPTLGVPLAGGQWGPLCSVGVQTSPGLRTLPSIKRRSSQKSHKHPLTKATDKAMTAETGGAIRSDNNSLPLSKETSQNEINSQTDDMGSQGSGSGVYCQIKTVQTNLKDVRVKRTAQYANGSVVTSDVVGGVCSETSEIKESARERRRVQSLRGEGHRAVLKPGSVCTVHATTPWPCRMIATSPSRLCGTCGRRRSQITPCTGACRKRPVNQITASQTLPNPARKPSAATSQTRKDSPLQDSKTYTNTTETMLMSAHTSTKATQIQQLSHTIPKMHSSHSNQKSKDSKQPSRPLSAEFTQYKDSATQTTDTESAAVITDTQKTQTPPADVTEPHLANKQNHDLTKTHQDDEHTLKQSSANTNPKPPDPSVTDETPPLPPKNSPKPIHSKTSTPVAQNKPQASQQMSSGEGPKFKEITKQKSECFENDPMAPCKTHLKAQCNGAPGGLRDGHTGSSAPRGLEKQLLSVEENLLSNQEKIKVLLNVIQDLEKSKALSEGRSSYRTGQDINNCPTCQKTACIIYSVEHDFRQQEGCLQGVMEALEGEYDVPTLTLTKPNPAPSSLSSSSSARPSTKARVKKLRKKCFWWL
ncbi:INSYN2B protein [Thalassophryne amazonica]|uniref:INSYN2B protein n=1 Tax=Thalassophryne amazonica TaxID=390379 RepID=UPI0014723FC4|nr:INSYN2B protein [Thalassophryne amazonica]